MVNIARKIAIRIIDEFEELLAEYGIKIPDKNREGEEIKASIYGEQYKSFAPETNKARSNLPE